MKFPQTVSRVRAVPLLATRTSTLGQDGGARCLGSALVPPAAPKTSLFGRRREEAHNTCCGDDAVTFALTLRLPTGLSL